MPKKEERKLKKQAKRLHLSKEAEDAYVYGTMNKIKKARKAKAKRKK
jgi:hypothetical protein